MLERLSDVDWYHLTHAYGTASDLPNLIRSLASPDAHVWQPAFDELDSTIWHQGTLYEATAFTIPFLIELLRNDEILCRKPIARYLAELAAYCAPRALLSKKTESNDQNENHYSRSRDVDSDRKRIQLQQRTWISEVYDAIAQGLDLYMKLLESQDSALRMEIPYLLHALHTNVYETISIIQKRCAQEKDPQAKASLVAYIGNQQEYFIENNYNLDEFIASYSEHALVRIMASLSQIRYTKEYTSSQAVQVLLDGLIPSQEIDEMYRALPWSSQASDSLTRAISTALLSLSLDHADLLVPRLLEAFTQLDHSFQFNGWTRSLSSLDEIVHTLLHFTFQGKGLQMNEIPFLITNTQRTVLVTLLMSKLGLYSNEEIAKIMESLNFPYPWKLRFFLRIETPQLNQELLQPPQF